MYALALIGAFIGLGLQVWALVDQQLKVYRGEDE